MITFSHSSGKLGALRMLVVHGNAFALAAVAGAPDETETHAPASHHASAMLLGTRALLRLYHAHLMSCLLIHIFGIHIMFYPCRYADIPLSASVGKTLLQRFHESAARMRLPILSISAIILNSGGAGYSAPLAVRIGAEVTAELHRLLRCTEAYEDDVGECCLIGEVCATEDRTDKIGSGNIDSDISANISSMKCPPSTFDMCVAQGWLCRQRPRIVWDRYSCLFNRHFYVVSLRKCFLFVTFF